MIEFARPRDEWYEELGDVVWWNLDEDGNPNEPPWIGSPVTCGYPVQVEIQGPFGEPTTVTHHVGGWSGVHTHFTPLPGTPALPPPLTREYYVEYLSAGTAVANTTIRRLDPRSMVAALQHLPKGAYAFRFYDILRTTTPDGTVLTSGRLEISKNYWPGGALKTLAEVEQMQGTGILAYNMRANGWDRVVFSRHGNWPQPFDPERDEIIELPTPVDPTSIAASYGERPA